ncbi:hypothetical protein KUTeg_013127 [Tegillarca granosa]|uniref:Uncharacterized protein n=1 Tax=Tegillarca granosa TaxID=220873 RepID=A0ABQ9ESS8_TEGGR|nr:hypothetical protein KUTeg_013127 [Tegillarca granosa]
MQVDSQQILFIHNYLNWYFFVHRSKVNQALLGANPNLLTVAEKWRKCDNSQGKMQPRAFNGKQQNKL